MSEQETLDLAEEFNRYRLTALAEVEAPGPGAVRRTVRGRGRRRLAASATTALALFAGSAVGYAAMNGPDHRPGPVEPTPSVSVSPTPSPTPTPSPSGTSASPTAPVPDGRISRAQLLGASVTLPAWRAGPGCPTSQTRLSADDKEGVNWLLSLDYGDIDGDGAVETVALVQCVFGSGGPMQVVAFDRDEEGKVVTLGRVVATTIDKPQWLFALDVVGDGTVRVEVGDIAPGGGWNAEWSQRQWRGYRWSGDAFAQVSGPTTFGPNRHDVNLVVTATNLVLADAADGSRAGTVTVRIRNRVGAAAYVALRLGLPASLRPDGDGWAACRNDPETTREPVTCDLNGLKAGKDVLLTLGFRAAAGTTVGTGKADVDARPMDADFDFVEEVYDLDNTVTITYR
ncbi:hypothetical protein [Micromonospora parathelypteridis]|uniref:Uncharacterized protein n=1 Tax=Micromonospora parathelypteridis TaxID=1839617 RepID=A0A840W3C9_9ACTN|nr:hypothetical protein [Micromonospora parathelypteridis]GGO11110.1 hypothetical protein GCM10011576_19210 [Micromonospora parathelypteridis]